MNDAYAGWDQVGGYPEDAASAVRDAVSYARTQNQRLTPYYGYIRYRDGSRPKIYFFDLLDDMRAWLSQHVPTHDRAYDYAAGFAAANLGAPIAGLERYNYTPAVGGVPQVGNWGLFFLGLPLGAAAGYGLRWWQEPAATRTQVPRLREQARALLPGGGGGSGAPQPKVGYPWLDFVGQEYADGYDPSLALLGCDPSVGQEPWMNIVGQEPWMNIVGQEPWMNIVGQEPWLDIVGNEPWLDIVGNEYVGGDGYSVGGPWVEFAPWVGAEADEANKRLASARARSLIQRAIRDIAEHTPSMPPANYYVWWLPAPSPSPAGRRNVVFAPTAQILSFTTLDEAKDYVRALGQQSDVVARAVFDKTSRHWPNPVTWSTSTDAAHADVVLNYLGPPPTSAVGQYGEYGEYMVGQYGEYGEYMVGATAEEVKLEQAKENLRARARSMAIKRVGDAVGVIHTVRDNLWHAIAFDTADDADDWLNTATQDQGSYTYAAYFDKLGDNWKNIPPAAYIEKFGGYARSAPGPRPRRAPIVGATRAEIEAYRKSTQQIATGKQGAAVVVVITADGLAHSQSFNSLDDAIDGLNRVTSLGKANYVYAGAFEKGRDGTAYVQAEEFGDASVPVPAGTIMRDRPATTSGEWW